MPLMVSGKPIGSVPKSVQELLSKFPEFKDSAEKLCSKKPTKITPECGLLYVGQREMAATTPEDDTVHILGTEDATTCHMVALRHTGSGAVCLSHFDGCGLEPAVKKMIKLVTGLSKNKINQGRFELHLVGGFCDSEGTSEGISRKTLAAFHDNREEIHLVTACITDLNNTPKNNTNFPVVYGIAVNVKTGDIYHAEFPDHGPEQPLRSARHFTGSEDVINIYDPSSHTLTIGPFNYTTMDGIDLLCRLPADIIREHLSTSPDQEPKHFAESVRAAMFQIRDHPDPGKTVFKDGHSKCFSFENGKWNKVDDVEKVSKAMQNVALNDKV